VKILDDLKNFALRGNVIDLVVGFTVGAAFTSIAKSLVDDIIMPPVGVLMGSIDSADMYAVIKNSAVVTPGMTPATAKAAGAVTINYGAFINNVIAFLLVTLVMFFLIRLIQRLDDPFKKKQAASPTTKPCPQCCTDIPLAAKRCPNCTSQL
jgi:large conductance mechanosensitive channel